MLKREVIAAVIAQDVEDLNKQNVEQKEDKRLTNSFKVTDTNRRALKIWPQSSDVSAQTDYNKSKNNEQNMENKVNSVFNLKRE